MTGRFDEASAVLEEAIGQGGIAPGRCGPRARSSVPRAPPNRRRGLEPRDGRGGDPRDDLVFESAGDEAGLAMAWRLLAWAAGTACRFGDAAEASRSTRSSTRARGRPPPGAARGGRRTRPPPRSARRSSTRRSPVRGGDRADRRVTASPRASSSSVLAGLYAMQGEFEHARTLAARGRALFEELGLEMEKARLGMEAASIERLAGDLDAAERELRPPYDALDAVGEKYVLSTVAGFLAQTLLEQGLLEEASAFCERSRELTTEADVATQGLWRYVRGRILTRQGRTPEAEAIIREALACSSRRTRSSTRSRQRRARRGPRRGRSDRRGPRGLRGRAAASPRRRAAS